MVCVAKVGKAKLLVGTHWQVRSGGYTRMGTLE